MSLTDRQIDLYSRQIILRELGGTGQRRLLGGSCLLVGGGPALETAATYLAGAGVGAIDLAPAASAPIAKATLAYAPLRERAPDTALRTLGDGDPLVPTRYDAVLLCGTRAVAAACDRMPPSPGAPRLGWVVVSAALGGAVDVAVLPAGRAACFACATSEPEAASGAIAPQTAVDPVAWSLAGALAALAIVRWIAAIAPETAPRAVRLAPDALAWVDVALAARPRCPRGCPHAA